MTHLQILVGDQSFDAEFLDALAPRTCAWFRSLLPWSERMVHVRWSGEACWIPLGLMKADVGLENATTYPAPGQILLYPGGVSETEILLPYGPTRFYSKAGALAGNPFLQITGDLARWASVARDTLWTGAKPIQFRGA